jgi:hypothetical protein
MAAGPARLKGRNQVLYAEDTRRAQATFSIAAAPGVP